MSFRFVRARLSLPSVTAALLTAMNPLPAIAMEPRTEYRMSLTDVFGAYQSIIARREACGVAFPQAKSTTEKAYAAWHARHRKLIDELNQRVDMMIRAASRDEKEYAKNIGKYEGGILKQREEVKQTLLQQPSADLQLECKSFPEFLQSADSDLEKEFAEQLAILRKRPLAKR